MKLKGIFKGYKETRDKIKHRAFYMIGLFAVYIILQVLLSILAYKISTKFNIPITILMLYFTAVTIMLFVGYSKIVGNHSFENLGFKPKIISKNYIYGLVFGFLAYSFTMVIGIIFGLQSTELNSKISPLLIIYFIGFVIQGMSEEVMLRGVIFPEMASKLGIPVAIIGNSLIFALLHGANPNFSLFSMAFVNLVMFGIFASLTYYYTENLWLIGAFHSIWNFAQGNIFGVRVSGLDIDISIFKTMFLKSPILTGGEFGTEGGVLGFISLVLCICFVYIYRNKFSKMNNLEVNYENQRRA